MGDWKPLDPPSYSRRKPREEVVRLYRSGQLHLSEPIVARFGESEYVLPCRNSHPSMVGIMATERRPGVGALKAKDGNLSSMRIVAAMGKVLPADSVTLPHHWDGDVLVVDLSGLPDAPGGR